jgi:transposase-like protein
MSPKKITDADKLEIVSLYRQSGETTASLANRYGVSNSTISRLLKNTIPDDEYDVLIQQKRGTKVGGEEEQLVTTAVVNSHDVAQTQLIDEQQPPVSEAVEITIPPVTEAISTESDSSRRVRRRSSAPIGDARDLIVVETVTQLEIEVNELLPIVETSLPELSIQTDEPKVIIPPIPVRTSLPTPVSRTPVLRDVRSRSIAEDEFSPSVAAPLEEELLGDEIDEDPEDVSILAAMFGEEISDIEEDEDFADEDDDEDSTTIDQQLDSKQLLTGNLQIQVTPLSQATLPRTCYIVIDKFAELIVRPLKDFAELGQIPEDEFQQRTLPIFDNHRVAKRFSNQRTQRVIKVPDSKVFHKTSHHLRSKGIARLLVDGNIYSLN